MKVLMTVAYDGTDYSGYQWQANGVTVQEKLENALSTLFGKQITVAGASRTDAGVHALGQRVAFSTDSMQIPLDKLPYAVNTKLPSDISVKLAEEVGNDFNPRWAKEKTYFYQICNSRFPNPLLRNYAWFVPGSLDMERMQAAAAAFEGNHDFAAFCAAGSSAKTTTRTVYECGIQRDGELITLFIRGNGFLYNMIRIITGTVVYAGQRKIPASSVADIISSGDRTRAGKTAPPQGLFLKEICY